jgi:uncharacterized protein (TIGR02231 family)
MIRSARIVPLAFLFALPAGVAHAALIESTSHVSDVTIYSDRAMVTRSAKIHVPAGDHVISITDMPAGLNEATLRVQGKAAGAVKIGTVEVKHVFLNDLANTAERDKAAQIDAKVNEKAFLLAEMQALKTKEDFITRIVESGALNHDANGNAKLDFAPEKWQQAWTLVQSGMAETEKDLANKNIAMKKIDAEINRLQLELVQMRSQQDKERRDARVNVEAAADTDLDLSLTYQTEGASWRPVYDARLETSSGQLALEQYGAVTQSTGEDWGDVALTLSTERPASGSEMPHLGEWWLRLFHPVAQRMAEPAGGAPSMYMKSRSLSAMDGAAMRAPGVPTPSPVEAIQVTANAETTEYSAEFKVPGRVEVKSTNDMTKLYLGAIKLKAALAIQTSPRLGPQAYLFATATNNETYPLIPGIVAKYRDGTFIGNAGLPMVRPNEEAKFAFGVDDRIKVDYKRIKEAQDNPALAIMGDMTIEREYQTKVQNLHKEPVSITILDQYPASDDPDIKVTVLDDETTAGSLQDTERRQGVIAWTDSYKSGEEKIYTLGFRVKYPKGQNIQGL